MNIYFSENIKQLRKERDLTQEALADFLGISFQAVSKWERGESYPEIEMLPVIAAFFGITVDELLGIDKSVKEESITAYISKYENMRLKDTTAVLHELKAATKEFPNEYAILIRYMELLQTKRNHLDAAQDSKEISSMYERIQKYCTDDEIRIRSKRIMIDNLLWQYDVLGYDEHFKERAETIIASLPKLEDAKEIAISKTANADNRSQLFGKEIEELTYLLQNAVIRYCYYTNNFTIDYKIQATEHMNGIIQMLDTDAEPTKNRIHLIYNYGHLGHWYFEKGDKQSALHYLKLAAQQAVTFDSMPESEQTAIYYEQEERFHNMSMRKRMRELMTEHYPLSDEFKAAPEFQEIIDIMK
jgi:transcriptional regulator with XRE-family HTH domain